MSWSSDSAQQISQKNCLYLHDDQIYMISMCFNVNRVNLGGWGAIGLGGPFGMEADWVGVDWV